MDLSKDDIKALEDERMDINEYIQLQAKQVRNEKWTPEETVKMQRHAYATNQLTLYYLSRIQERTEDNSKDTSEILNELRGDNFKKEEAKIYNDEKVVKLLAEIKDKNQEVKLDTKSTLPQLATIGTMIAIFIIVLGYSVKALFGGFFNG